MKIIIFTLVIAAFSLISINSMCPEVDIKLSSTLGKVVQDFKLDVKQVINVAKNINVNNNDFKALQYVPLEQVGLVLKKTASSKTLDATVHQYMRNEPEVAWLPYAHIGGWGRRSPYQLTAQMSRTSDSKTARPMVTVEFVNDPTITSVSNEDMEKFRVSIQANTDARINIKKTVKERIDEKQNAYLSANTALNNAVAGNKSNQQQIAELEKKLATVNQEIAALAKQEEENLQQIAVKSAALTSVVDKLKDVNNKLAVLYKRLKQQQAELANAKPTDTSALQADFAVNAKSAQYPPVFPQRFLEEYAVAATEVANLVKKGYQDCDGSTAKFDACNQIAQEGQNYIGAKKKLRKKLF